MKVKIISIRGLFTQTCGVDIPVWTVMGEANNIPEAADYVHKIFKGDKEVVEAAGIIFMEDPTS